MPDLAKKIMKNRAEDLHLGETVLAATVGQPSGTFSRQAMGGLVGVLAAKKIASTERTRWTGQATAAWPLQCRRMSRSSSD